jgi:hypothetical protein
MAVDVKQSSGGGRPLTELTFTNESFKGVVVHAMADGEWGGVQYEVASADKLPSGNGKVRRLLIDCAINRQGEEAINRGSTVDPEGKVRRLLIE